MNDGPIDYGSGYFFASQKGISDRRAALGLDQGRTRSGSSKPHTIPASGAGGGDIIASLARAAVWFAGVVLVLSGVAAFLIAKFVIAPLILSLIGMILGRGRVLSR